MIELQAFEDQLLGGSSDQLWVCDLRPIKTVPIQRNVLLRESQKRILAQPSRRGFADELEFGPVGHFPTYSREHLSILGALDLSKAYAELCGSENKRGAEHR